MKERQMKGFDAIIWPEVIDIRQWETPFQTISDEVYISEPRKHRALFKQADSQCTV